MNFIFFLLFLKKISIKYCIYCIKIKFDKIKLEKVTSMLTYTADILTVARIFVFVPVNKCRVCQPFPTDCLVISPFCKTCHSESIYGRFYRMTLHCVPPGPSLSSTPIARSSSLTASEAAQFLSALA